MRAPATRRFGGAWGPSAGTVTLRGFSAGLVLMLVAVTATPFFLAAASAGGATPAAALPMQHPPARTAHLPLAAGVRPTAQHEWYTQEGATLSAVGGSTGYSPSTLIEDFTLVTSPYSTGYELNGLSNTGDWYQIVVADNWPGCNSGFEEVTEVWDSTGSTGPVDCDPSLTLTAGDVVELELTISSSSTTCLNLLDLTAGTSDPNCQSQPDTGATGFVLLGAQANGNGYYTGPMTETVNLTASGCPDYAGLPLVTYRYPPPTYVTAYIPWSDEWDVFGGFCFSGGGGSVNLPAGSPAVQYTDTAAGTGFGSRWGAGENASYLSAAVAFQYQTDPKPITSASLAAEPTLLLLGQNTTFWVNGSGGVGPYASLLAVNGTVDSLGASSGVFSPPGAGLFTLTAYLVDAQADAYGPTNAVLIDVPGVLSVGPVGSTPTPGAADVGQLVTFTARVSGGFPPRTYTWSGLPTGCASANLSSISCAATAAGTFTVGLSVEDSNHTTVVATPLSFRVSADPSVGLVANLSQLDVGQSVSLVASPSGGAGGFQLAWSNLPLGCPGANVATLLCRPTGAGTYSVQVTATDANGFPVQAALPLILVVNARPTVLLTESRNAVDVGGGITFTASPSGGSSPVDYSWSGLPPGCLSQDAAIVSCQPSTTGVYSSISVHLTDGAGVSASSNTLSLSVFAALMITVSASPATVHVQSLVTLTAEVGGGASAAALTWSGLPDGCTGGNVASLTCAPSVVGSYDVSVSATDATGAAVVGHTNLTVVEPAPSTFALGSTWVWVLVALGVVVVVGVAVALARRRSR